MHNFKTDVEICEACKQPLSQNNDAKRHYEEYMEKQAERNKPLTDEEKKAEFMKTPAGIAMAKELENARPLTDEEKKAEFMKTPAGIAMAKELENARPLTDEEKKAEFMKTPAGIAMAKELENARPLTDEEKKAEFMKTPAGIAMAKNLKDDQEINQKRKALDHDRAEFKKEKEIKDNAKIRALSAELIKAKAARDRDNELKGEILEERFTDYLNDWFQDEEDKIVSVKKGAPGGDVVQEVIIGGKMLNKIKLECKNKKTPPGQSDIDKLRNDMILHKALYGVIVTSVVPKNFQAPHMILDDGLIYILDANEPDIAKMVVQALRNYIKVSYNAVRNLPSAQKEAALTKWATSDHTRALLRNHLKSIKADYDGIVSDETNQKKRINARKKRNNEMRESITDLFTPLSVMESTKDINLLEELDDDAD